MSDYEPGTRLMWAALESASQGVAGRFPGLIRSVAVLVHSSSEAELYVFFFSDDQLATCADSNLERGLLDLLKKKTVYPAAALERLRFKVIFDSHENVVKNYEGSYFLRLR